MRAGWAFTLAGNGRWPGDAGGRETSRFRYLRVHHRTLTAVQPVVCCLDGPPVAQLDDDRTWDVFYPGERRIRNTGGINDGLTDDLQFLNLDPNPVVLYVETSDTPIIDIASAPNQETQTVQAAAGATFSIFDTSQFFLESSAALAASATFTGPWRDCININWIGLLALTDAAGGTLVVDEADAATPTVTNLVAKQAVAATDALAPSPPAAGQQARIAPQKVVLRFLRARFVNGATVQTRFNLQSTLSPVY